MGQIAKALCVLVVLVLLVFVTRGVTRAALNHKAPAVPPTPAKKGCDGPCRCEPDCIVIRRRKTVIWHDGKRTVYYHRRPHVVY